MPSPSPADLAARLRALPQEQQAEALDLLRKLDLHRQAHPLAHARLWHRASPRTSQRRAVQSLLGPRVLFGFALGGNRSGKSEAGAQLDVAFALGRDHPDVVAWAVANRLDVSVIPLGPGEVWSVAGNSGRSRGYVRPAVARYCPAGTRWRNRDGDGPATAFLPGGGKVGFKSVEETASGFEGAAVRLVRFDEEPDDYSVVTASLMRIADLHGRLLLTMTPLWGWTRLLREHVREPSPDDAVVWLHGEDNPHMDPAFLRRLYAHYGSHEERSRRFGEITALEGRVYVDWDRAVHVVPAHEVPAEWPLYAAADWGVRNPTCLLFLALDVQDHVVHVLREWYHSERTTSEIAAAVRAIEAEVGKPELRWGDPASPQVMADLTAQYDLEWCGARKGEGSVRAGISRVAALLRPDAQGRPHCVVHDCCVQTIREIESYVWEERASGQKDQPDAPLKRDDHAMDALRYGVSGIEDLWPPPGI